MKEKEYNVVTLEDGLEYAEVKKIRYNGILYLFLSSLENDDNFCIRKLVDKNGKQVLIGLDDEAEFNEILSIFVSKNFN